MAQYSPVWVRATRSIPVSVLPRDARPEPDVGEFSGVFGVRAQVGEHQTLESVAFVAFGKRQCAVSGEGITE
jgi:hypothetical protein